MKKKITLLFFVIALHVLSAQHTFSIVAVDSVTGEIGSAGATCGDSIIWPGTPGAYIISQVLPGAGAIHTQALWDPNNQANARLRMQAGDSPQQILDWMQQNDEDGNPTIRQYGVVDYNNGHPRSAAFTGSNCLNYKNHITGPGYAIQGNILLGQQILDSMEARYLRTQGSLADKLMASLQGANVVGADTRCMADGTSSLSAFIRVAKPGDDRLFLYLDINVAGTGEGVEPIDVLQNRFDNWKTTAADPTIRGELSLSPNPAEDQIFIKTNRVRISSWRAWDALGKYVDGGELSPMEAHQLSTQSWADGIYWLAFYEKGEFVAVRKVMIRHHH